VSGAAWLQPSVVEYGRVAASSSDPISGFYTGGGTQNVSGMTHPVSLNNVVLQQLWVNQVKKIYRPCFTVHFQNITS
jgi:hypothetical protein